MAGGAAVSAAWETAPCKQRVAKNNAATPQREGVRIARFMAMYQQQAEKYGYTASPQQLGWATPVYVSDSDEAARREARPHIEAFYNKFLKMPVEMLLPPGYLSLTSMASI